MNTSHLKLVHLNPNHTPKARTKEDVELIGTTAHNIELINTNLNILLKELGKVGMLENTVVLSRINVLKQVIYTTQDLLKENM